MADSGAGFSLRVLALAMNKPRRLKPAPLDRAAQEFARAAERATVNDQIKSPVSDVTKMSADRSTQATHSQPSSDFKFQSSNLKFEILLLDMCLAAAIFVCGCGYHVGGAAVAQLPPGLKVIAVPSLTNDTPRYRIEQRMTEAVVHEFIARTKYHIVSNEDLGDAVLHGEITSFEAIPAVFDTTPATTTSTTVPSVTTTSARATTMLVSVHLKVSLEDRETKRVLYKSDDYLFRQPYEISTDPSRFFDEQGPALERMSRDFASRLVADILENF